MQAIRQSGHFLEEATLVPLRTAVTQATNVTACKTSDMILCTDYSLADKSDSQSLENGGHQTNRVFLGGGRSGTSADCLI